MALMSLAAPAYAVTEDSCTELEGRIERQEDRRVCVFPLSPTACQYAFEGTPTADEDGEECTVPVE
jgi:hypothetical protein